MITATFIKKLTEGNWRGDARLYQLSLPIGCEAREGDGYIDTHTDHVIISQTLGLGAEVMIFPADANGDELSLLEIEQFVGMQHHELAIIAAGWVPV